MGQHWLKQSKQKLQQHYKFYTWRQSECAVDMSTRVYGEYMYRYNNIRGLIWSFAMQTPTPFPTPTPLSEFVELNEIDSRVCLGSL